MTAPSYNRPRWPASYFALIGEPGTGREHDVLAVCRVHEPPHIVYVPPRGEPWCQELPAHDRRQRFSRLRDQPTPTPIRIEIVNADDLGEAVGSGLVLAYRRVRAERKAAQARSTSTPAEPGSTTLPTVPVWRSDDGSDT
jgi:hypothetical protein